MAKVYDALKRLEEERTLQERLTRQEPHKKATHPSSAWTGWFRRQTSQAPQVAPERQLLDRLDKLARDVEAVRVARKANASDVDARVDALKAQIDRLESHIKELDQRLTGAAGTAADTVRSRLGEVGNRLLLVGALSVLALCVALLRA